MRSLIAIILLLCVMYACSRAPELKPNRTADQYLAHLANTPATTEQNVAQIFGTIFSDFKKGATEQNIRAVYANDIYFNDTFKIIDNIDDLVHYMSESANQVESTTVEILDVIHANQDYFVRWVMDIRVNIQGRDVHSRSIGMTQLRFNAAGQVVFHQDFWDSSEAFYEHLPFLGRLVKKVKTML